MNQRYNDERMVLRYQILISDAKLALSKLDDEAGICTPTYNSSASSDPVSEVRKILIGKERLSLLEDFLKKCVEQMNMDKQEQTSFVLSQACKSQLKYQDSQREQAKQEAKNNNRWLTQFFSKFRKRT